MFHHPYFSHTFLYIIFSIYEHYVCMFIMHTFIAILYSCGASHVALVVKNPPANSGDIRDVGLIPGSGRSPEGRHGNPLQYSCLENPHRQRNLVGYGPFCRKELDITDQLSTHNIYICIHNVSSVQSDSEIP